MTMTSASASSSVDSRPAWSSRPAMRSESWTFIWQPNVSMRYFLATAVGFAFAFRFCFLFRLRPPGLPRAGSRSARRPRRQQLAGAGPHRFGDRGAANHPRDLLHPSVGVQALDRCRGAVAADVLLDAEVRGGPGRDLRQVRDAQDLEVPPERGEVLADDLGDAPADAGVHFVEDERHLVEGLLAGTSSHRPGFPDRHRLQRQHDTRELAAGDDPRQGPRLLPRVGRDVELRLVDAPLGPRVLGERAIVEADLEAGARHGQLGEQRLELRGERCRGGAPRARQAAGGVEKARGGVAERALQILGALAVAGQQVAFAAQRVARRNDVLEPAAVLPLETIQQRQALLDLLQPRRRGVHAVGVAAEEERQVFELRLDAVAGVQVAGELRIDGRQLADTLPDAA